MVLGLRVKPEELKHRDYKYPYDNYSLLIFSDRRFICKMNNATNHYDAKDAIKYLQ